MTRRLKLDHRFQPCPVDDGDELFPNGVFIFNMTKMIEHIQRNIHRIPLETIAVRDYSPEFSIIDESHVNSANIEQPGILAEISPGRYNLIDGHHRLEKARRMGIERIPVYKLDIPEHLKFLTTRKAYEFFVGYWNGKLKQNR